MKLLNYTTMYLAGILFVILLVWAGILYYSMLDEIYDSMDDGLENQKLLVLQKAANDSSILSRDQFEEGYYTISAIQDPGNFAYQDVYSDTSMFMQNEQDFEPVRLLTTTFKQQGQWYKLKVITSMVEEDDLIEDLAYALLWLYLGVIAVIIILNNLLLKRIWKPFYDLIKKLSGFKLEKPTEINGEPNIEEFKILYDSVRGFLQSNLEAYQAQKQFIENAAHELHTPIGIMRNRLELLIEKGDFNEEQVKDWKVIMDNVNRMGKLNKSLLLLAKIENKQFDQHQSIDINEMISEIVDNLEAIANHKNVSVSMQFVNQIHVDANPDLLFILLNNLIKNAVNHNVNPGRVDIVLDAPLVIIKNSGYQSLESKQIFNRFYKMNASSSSTGLGLAIVKAICDMYHLDVNYQFVDQQHVFQLNFSSL
ncbi:type IX secretion system histidine kinase PorY [Fulvivirga ligni]|uniref:sensor histidine kinase n=1 Tax=Fulvivirga ligni TaxID=2904246 RepID=UPI001F33955E|nr:HAMP domain-containing sensor histidine kinase [Fulvivirga ligni]UII19684.1 HAMP domain-containing histidine kinase [Fulvivirga ligni]